MRKRVTVTSRVALLGLVALLAEVAPVPGCAASEPAAAVRPTFVALPPIVLPVFEGNLVTRQAGVMLTLELEAGKTATDVEPQRRRLVDAFISDLYALFEQRHDAGRVIETGLIKGRLGETAARILGPGIVREVLIQQAFERQRGR